MIDGILQLSERDLQEVAGALRSGRIGMPPSALSVQRVVPGDRGALAAQCLAGLAGSGFGSEQLATLLEAVLAERRQHAKADNPIELVTTGPGDHLGTRDTSVVVRELFASANESVLVAGYAVYQGQKVFQALADRMQERPELKVRLFLDIQRSPTDTTASDDLVRRFAYRFKTSEWPKDRPLPEVYYDPRSLEQGPQRSSLHAKCVVVDGQKVFVSSANFTEAAQMRNIEVGLVLDTADVAGRVTAFFEAMALGRVLMPVGLGRGEH